MESRRLGLRAKTCVSAIFALAPIQYPPVQAAPTVVTPESLIQVVSGQAAQISDRRPSISLDAKGQWLAVSMSPVRGLQSEVFGLEIKSDKWRDLGRGHSVAMAPRGARLAYVDERGNLIVRRLEKAAAPTELHLRLPVGALSVDVVPGTESFAWSPDGSSLAIVRPSATDVPLPGQSAGRASRSELWVWNARDHRLRRLYRPQSRIADVAWLGTGSVLFSQAPALAQSGVAPASLMRLYLRDGRIDNLIRDVGRIVGVSAPAGSPDGQHVFFRRGIFPVLYVAGFAPEVLDVNRHTVRIFPTSPVTSIARYYWDEQSRSVRYLCKARAFSNMLCRAPIDKRKLSSELLDPNVDILGLAISHDGRKMAWISQDPADTVRIRMRFDREPPRTLMRAPRRTVSNLRFGRTVEVSWTSFDGLRLWGLLTLPVGYTSGSRVPLIVDVHGGPDGGVSLSEPALLQAGPLEWQMWAGLGYAVFAPDYRESRVYGALPRYVLRVGLLEKDSRDVEAGIQSIVTAGVADPRRIALIGHSMGATVVNWMVTRRTRFACAISKEGVIDWRPQALTKGALLETRLWDFQATDKTLAERLAEESPIVRAERVKTPILLITSDYSHGSDAEPFVDRINAAGGEARWLKLKSDFHVTRRSDNARLSVQHAVDWVRTHFARQDGDATNR